MMSARLRVVAGLSARPFARSAGRPPAVSLPCSLPSRRPARIAARVAGSRRQEEIREITFELRSHVAMVACEGTGVLCDSEGRILTFLGTKILRLAKLHRETMQKWKELVWVLVSHLDTELVFLICIEYAVMDWSATIPKS